MKHWIPMMMVAAAGLIGCSGGDGNPCRELCCEVEGKVEEQLMVEIDCSEEKWASAATCAGCLYVLERDYQATMIDPGEVCEKHFGPEPTAEDFVQGTDYDPCTAIVPVCQTTAGCTLGDQKHTRGSFPGYASFVVVTPADAVIVVRLFFENQSHPGEDTQITWYEPGCNDSYDYQSQGADILSQVDADGVFSREQAVRMSGDHLVEIYSDSTADYHLRVEVIVD